MKRLRHAERGFSLIIAVSIIALLTLFGVLVLDASHGDVQLAGGDRAAQNTLFIAEAGIVTAKQQLVNLLYPPGTSSSAANVAALMALTSLAANDALCPENACVSAPCPTPIRCSDWYALTPAAGQSYGTGSYRAAATCNPNCSLVTPPASYSVRALALSPDGAQRLLEITVGP